MKKGSLLTQPGGRHTCPRAAVLATFGGMILALNSSNSHAQTPPASADSSATSSAQVKLEEVVVTGTHIARSTFTTPNPVTMMDAQQIENLGLTNVGDVLAQLPQNSSLYSPAAQSNSNFNTGATFANLRGLNPFFGTRTLTMIDSQRVVPTSSGGAVDLNLIPSLLVERIETVTGGASAAYGSDAVAGVVNVILNTNLNGFKGQADFGRTFAGDGNDYHASAAYGIGFAGGAGHVIVGGEYEKQDSIGNCAQVRDWCATNYAVFTNPAYAATGGPQYIVGPNGKTTATTLTGVLYAPSPFFPGAGSPLGQFSNAGNTLSAFDPGLYGGPLSQAARMGGDGTGVGVYDQAALLPQIKHYSLFTHANYDLTDTLQAFAEGSYARRDANTYQAQAGAMGTFIAPDNAFLDPTLAALIPAGGYLYRSGNDLAPTTNDTKDDTWRFSAGLKGNLIAGWAWDGYVQYGHHTTDSLVENDQASTYFAQATDAVLTNPALPFNATSNPVVCRSRAPGCAPLDLFGTDPGAANPQQAAAFAYAYRPLVDDLTNSQEVAALNLHGDVSEGWGAGPIKAAVGAEYRREHISDEHDFPNAASYYYQQFANYGDPFTGTTKVTEGYGELDVPVLKDLPFVKALELDAAIRETQNKTDGSVDRTYNPSFPAGGFTNSAHSVDFSTWKLSGVWDTTDWLRLRATRSRDVRAPSFEELFTQHVYPTGTPFFPTTNPNQGPGGATYFPEATFNANPNLNPEKANTTTAGFVFSPTGWASGLQLSVDWYQIELHGAIALLPNGVTGPTQAVVNNCVVSGAHCDLINGGTFTQGSTAPITLVNDAFLNLGLYTTRGFDVEVGYHTPLSAFMHNWAGNLDFRTIMSYTYDMIIDTGNGLAPINYVGQSGPAGGFSGSYNPTPKVLANMFITYGVSAFTGTVQFKYVGSGHLMTSDGTTLTYTCTTAICGTDSINDNHVASAFYTNLAASYRITKEVELFARIDNLMNRDPPIAPGAMGSSNSTNPGLFDTLGRAWKAGVRLAF